MEEIIVSDPIIEVISEDTANGLKDFRKELDTKKNIRNYIVNYPTVYIHNWKKSNKYEVYVGESNDFFQRTQQHFDKSKDSKSWQKNLDKNAQLYVIAHEDFNKSLTLDIENKLIHYLSSIDSVKSIHNSRGNPQNEYYPVEKFEPIFKKIWQGLRNKNEDLFLSEKEIENSALYKASPCHKLNKEQLEAKEKIIGKVLFKLSDHKNSKNFILVEGDAGTGKTVLMSNLFLYFSNYHIVESETKDETITNRKLKVAMIVNHNEQLTVYKEIVKKLGIANWKNCVFKATPFLNQAEKENKEYDIVFIDEAHLLLTKKVFRLNPKYSNQLEEICKHSKIVVSMFDRHQIMNAQQYIDTDTITEMIEECKKNDSYIRLSEQMRLRNCNDDTISWIESLYTKDRKIPNFPSDLGEYEIKFFDNPTDLHNAIKEKADNKKTRLSRLVATFDWDYGQKRNKKDEKGYWCVEIDDFKLPWNNELAKDINKKDKASLKHLSWQEQKQTINEVGSTYTIQGFDLNYAGVILGPSVIYQDGEIKIDPSKSKNVKIKEKIQLFDGEKRIAADEFIRNEVKVLLTRGVNGLYIYACNKELREYLLKQNNI